MDPQALDNLAGKMVAGNKQAYCQFAEYFGPRLRAFYRSRGLSITDAEALAITCITDTCLRVDRYEPKCNFNAWVYTLARHMLIDWWRKEVKGLPILFTDLDVGLRDKLEESPTEDPEVSSVAQSVHEALLRLNEGDRTIIQMHDLGGDFTHSEIAEVLQMKTGAVRVRYLRARAKLKVLLEGDPRMAERFTKCMAASC